MSPQTNVNLKASYVTCGISIYRRNITEPTIVPHWSNSVSSVSKIN